MIQFFATALAIIVSLAFGGTTTEAEAKPKCVTVDPWKAPKGLQPVRLLKPGSGNYKTQREGWYLTKRMVKGKVTWYVTKCQ